MDWVEWDGRLDVNQTKQESESKSESESDLKEKPRAEPQPKPLQKPQPNLQPNLQPKPREPQPQRFCDAIRAYKSALETMATLAAKQLVALSLPSLPPFAAIPPVPSGAEIESAYLRIVQTHTALRAARVAYSRETALANRATFAHSTHSTGATRKVFSQAQQVPGAHASVPASVPASVSAPASAPAFFFAPAPEASSKAASEASISVAGKKRLFSVLL